MEPTLADRLTDVIERTGWAQDADMQTVVEARNRIAELEAAIGKLAEQDGKFLTGSEAWHDLLGLTECVGMADRIAELEADLEAWENTDPLSPDPERVQLRWAVKRIAELEAEVKRLRKAVWPMGPIGRT